MNTKLLWLITFIYLGFLFGCNDLTNDDPDQDIEQSGAVVIKITDAPFPADMVEEANVTIDWIKLLKSEDDGEGDDEEENGDDDGEGDNNGENGDDDGDNGESEEYNNPSSILIELEARTINLLELSNGITDILVEADVPAGVYREIRLHIVNAGIKLNDNNNTEFNLKVPSGDASGLKIKIRPPINVEAGMTSEILLDFDLSRSFVMRGNMKHGHDKLVGFIFKPVVRAVAYNVEPGEIHGVVSDTSGALIENALLTLLSGTDNVTTSITSDENEDKGFYRMIGISSGEYSLSCEKEGYEKQVVENLIIESGEEKEQNFELVKTEESEDGDNGD